MLQRTRCGGFKARGSGMSAMITEATAIIETYAFLRPLVVVISFAAVIALALGIALQRAGRNK